MTKHQIDHVICSTFLEGLPVDYVSPINATPWGYHLILQYVWLNLMMAQVPTIFYIFKYYIKSLLQYQWDIELILIIYAKVLTSAPQINLAIFTHTFIGPSVRTHALKEPKLPRDKNGRIIKNGHCLICRKKKRLHACQNLEDICMACNHFFTRTTISLRRNPKVCILKSLN